MPYNLTGTAHLIGPSGGAQYVTLHIKNCMNKESNYAGFAQQIGFGPTYFCTGFTQAPERDECNKYDLTEWLHMSSHPP
jgi:hypothetical protein